MLNRRTFVASCAAAALGRRARGQSRFDAAEFDRPRVLRNAQRYLTEKPITVTAAAARAAPAASTTSFRKATIGGRTRRIRMARTSSAMA